MNIIQNGNSIHISGKGGTVVVNGVSITGDMVGGDIVIGDKVVVGGKELDISLGRTVEIKILGDVDTVETVSADVHCATAGSIKTTSGDVVVNHSVSGNVSTMSGDVEAHQIDGRVSTMSGNVSKEWR